MCFAKTRSRSVLLPKPLPSAGQGRRHGSGPGYRTGGGGRASVGAVPEVSHRGKAGPVPPAIPPGWVRRGGFAWARFKHLQKPGGLIWDPSQTPSGMFSGCQSVFCSSTDLYPEVPPLLGSNQHILSFRSIYTAKPHSCCPRSRAPWGARPPPGLWELGSTQWGRAAARPLRLRCQPPWFRHRRWQPGPGRISKCRDRSAPACSGFMNLAQMVPKSPSCCHHHLPWKNHKRSQGEKVSRGEERGADPRRWVARSRWRGWRQQPSPQPEDGEEAPAMPWDRGTCKRPADAEPQKATGGGDVAAFPWPGGAGGAGGKKIKQLT